MDLTLFSSLRVKNPVLYETSLRALNGKSQPKPLELSDGRGLGVRVSKEGKIRFQYRYKIQGRNKRMDLGSFLTYRSARRGISQRNAAHGSLKDMIPKLSVLWGEKNH
ncbi:Arm DNA-binding domain-containing protein [Shewanella xiamenensis]|uniref:Arm DNA-binding domain-containing protein n=1 Tax=Shewanella xiamenensis TaxID=332186 RepID=UPI001C4E0950|nr:Arm DNA-binding domain-containing protein [Shewanella xiamenensis]MDH1313573.1 Arm DNA-binding domain-containing protein [Shewanella xiamenensis]